MSGLFGVLDLSARAMRVVQGGVRVTSHNISNVETPGYSRQRAVLEAGHPIQSGEGFLGTGVEQRTIQRVTDEFVQQALVRQGSSLGSTEAQSNALDQIEEILNEQSGEGITSGLSKLYASFQDLATSPTPRQPAEREAVRSQADAVADQLHRADTSLRELRRSTDRAIVDELPEINDLSRRILALNQEIGRAEASAPANDLRDQRDQLVRELAGHVDISTFEQDGSFLVITLSNGLPLVEGLSVRELTAMGDPTDPFDPMTARIVYDDGVSQIDVTDRIGGGSLGGRLRVRDTLVPAAIRSLDTVAYNLAVSVNAVHAAGVGLDGVSGDFFAAPAAVEDAAKNLALDARVRASTDAIAAGLTSGATDNRNALALAALRDAAAPIFLPGDPPGPATGPTRSVLDHASSVVADVGYQARTLSASRDQQARVMQGLEDRREEVSGVSLDEEVTQLIRLQASFQANARVVSVIDRLLQDLVGML